MHSTPKNVTTYLDEVPAERKAALAKHFIGLSILRLDVMSAHRDLFKVKGVSSGKGCIRYSKPEKIDFKVVEMMLKATQASTGVICGHNTM